MIFNFQAGKGVLRSMIGDVNAVSDIIPVDLAVNMLVCVGWYAGTKRYVFLSAQILQLKREKHVVTGATGIKIGTINVHVSLL